MHQIFRIWPGFIRSEKAYQSLRSLRHVYDIPAVISTSQSTSDRSLACTKSHARALMLFLSTETSHAVVLEDDAILNGPHDWLGFTEFDLFLPFASNRARVLPDTTVLDRLPEWGSHAYLVSRAFAEELLRVLQTGAVSDHAIKRVAKLPDRQWKIGSYAGNVVRHDCDVPSMIDESRRLYFSRT